MKITLAIILFLLWFFLSLGFADTLIWSPNPDSDFVTAYNVYTVKHGNYTLVGTTFPPTTFLVIDAFLSGNRTNFVVTAVNSAGEGGYSGQVTDQIH